MSELLIDRAGKPLADDAGRARALPRVAPTAGSTVVIADGGPGGGARVSGRDRLAEAVHLLETDPGGTHPDGCVALIGYYADAPDRLWWLVRSSCRFAHPETMRGLRVQYARRGWAMTYPDPLPDGGPTVGSGPGSPLNAPLWMWVGYLCGVTALAVVATTGGAGSAAIVVLTALLSVFFWVFGTERGWAWTRSATDPVRMRIRGRRSARRDQLLAGLTGRPAYRIDTQRRRPDATTADAGRPQTSDGGRSGDSQPTVVMRARSDS